MKIINFVEMKKLALIFAAFTVSFFACDEEPPFIDLSEEVRILKDTSYIVSSIPLPQPKTVLLEDISGVNCVNCPDAALKAEEIKDRVGPRAIVATLIPDKALLPEFTDPKDVFTDLMQPKVNQLLNFIGNPTGLPVGMINRGDYGNGINMPFQRWDGDVDDELLKTTEVNVELDFESSSDLRELFVSVKVTYLENVTDTTQNITIFLAENDIVGVQKGRSGIINDYVFQHVVRDYATNAVGDPISVELQKGLVIERDYKMEIDPSWVLNNCEIIALVHSRTNKYVYQSASVKVK